MPRVKRSVSAKKKRRVVLARAKGYYGAKSRHYKKAKEQVRHSLQYQYRDRRNKKREVRRLWIIPHQRCCSYQRCVLLRVYEWPPQGWRRARPQGALRQAINDPEAFAALVEVSKAALK